MNSGLKLFRIFGIDIKIHFSWWFIFILLAWSLSAGFFPGLCGGEFQEGLFAHEVIPACQDLSTFTYWLMGIGAAILLFISVLLHELSHSLVAKLRKIKVDSITLFFFGGVASITDEEMKPSSEFLMAISGPILSILLGVVFLLINIFYVNGIVTAITFYLYFINFILAGFNLVPAYPLDGGRAFRAILHAYFKDLRKATLIASMGGRIFAGYMIIEGILNIFGVTILIPGGIWFILLGFFLYFIAGVSYEQVIIKEVLEKIPVRNLRKEKLTTLDPRMKLSVFIKQHIDKGENIFLIQNKSFSGLLDIRLLKNISPQQQKTVTLKDLAHPIKESVRENDHAYTAFRKISQQKQDIIPVMSKNKVIGFLSKNALMQRLMWGLKFGELSAKRTLKRLHRNQ